ncbi:MAG: hypothetical protein GY822_12560 [Deltaproteobacteria bacterium]|nr:hypothetical protein [Deltaproteobacteria bacterium]
MMILRCYPRRMCNSLESFSFGKKLLRRGSSCFLFQRQLLWVVALLIVTGALSCVGRAEPEPNPEPEPEQEEKCQGILVDLDFLSDPPVRTFDDLEVILAHAEPATPDRGDNTFTFSLKNNDGTPYRHPGDVLLSPFMPDHGHGSLPLDFTPLESSDFDAGELVFGPMDLFMLGRWDLHLRLLNDDGSERDAVFTFCIEG